MLVAVQLSVLGLYLPPVFKNKVQPIGFHPRRSFRCRSRLPCEPVRAAGALVVLVAVQLSMLGLYLPPVFTRAAGILAAPDDHFAASPHCRVAVSGSGRVGGAGGCPCIVAACRSTIRYCRKRIAQHPPLPSAFSRLAFRLTKPARTAAAHGMSMRMEVCYQTLRQHRPSQTLGDHKGIVAERFKEFAQHLRLLGVLCHAIHFSL